MKKSWKNNWILAQLLVEKSLNSEIDIVLTNYMSKWICILHTHYSLIYYSSNEVGRLYRFSLKHPIVVIRFVRKPCVICGSDPPTIPKFPYFVLESRSIIRQYVFQFCQICCWEASPGDAQGLYYWRARSRVQSAASWRAGSICNRCRTSWCAMGQNCRICHCWHVIFYCCHTAMRPVNVYFHRCARQELSFDQQWEQKLSRAFVSWKIAKQNVIVTNTLSKPCEGPKGLQERPSNNQEHH